MNRFSLLALLCVLPCVACATPTEQITKLLETQATAWNRGDVEGFMEYYLKDDALRFASGGSVTRGWQSTLDRYKKSYPDRAAMGILEFSDLEITELGVDAALAFGRWRLSREKDTPHGLFSLTLRRIDGAWRITQDHTSSGG